MKQMNFSDGDLGKSWMNIQRAKIITLGERLIIKEELLWHWNSRNADSLTYSCIL